MKNDFEAKKNQVTIYHRSYLVEPNFLLLSLVAADLYESSYLSFVNSQIDDLRGSALELDSSSTGNTTRTTSEVRFRSLYTKVYV